MSFRSKDIQVYEKLAVVSDECERKGHASASLMKRAVRGVFPSLQEQARVASPVSSSYVA